MSENYLNKEYYKTKIPELACFLPNILPNPQKLVEILRFDGCYPYTITSKSSGKDNLIVNLLLFKDIFSREKL
jgi:hypothetical protein